MFGILLPAYAQKVARVYVYEQWGDNGHQWRTISIDGAEVAKLRQGTFFAVDLSPGEHILSEDKGVPAVVKALAGTDSFVGLSWLLKAGERPLPILRVVPPRIAKKRMLDLMYIDPDKILSSLVSPNDPRPSPQLQHRGSNPKDR